MFRKIMILTGCMFLRFNLILAQDNAAVQLEHLHTETIIKEYPVLWLQKAAGYRALCYQAFNIATLRLQQLTTIKKGRQKPAIITGPQRNHAG